MYSDEQIISYIKHVYGNHDDINMQDISYIKKEFTDKYRFVIVYPFDKNGMPIVDKFDNDSIIFGFDYIDKYLTEKRSNKIDNLTNNN